jgi:hypothetical protein
VRPDRRYPDALAAALADGAAVDWDAAQSAAASAHADVVRQLRVIASLRAGHDVPRTAAQPWLRQAVTVAFSAGIAVTALKVIVALGGVPAAFARLPGSPALMPFAFNLIIFGIGGLLLIVGGTRDRRLQLLGALYVTIASAFVEPFSAPGDGAAGALLGLLNLWKTDAFFLPAVWLFAWAFPREPLEARGRTALGAIAVATTGAAWLLVVANIGLYQNLWDVDHPVGRGILSSFDRRAAGSLYWRIILLGALPAVPFLFSKLRRESGKRRRQLRWFLGALAVGLTPLIVVAAAAPFVPALRDPAMRQRLGVVIFVALGSIVPVTAYAVGVQQVMDVRFVIAATLRYALARYAIWAVILAPLTWLATDVFVNRGLTFLQYLDTRHPAGVIALSVLGLLALTFRPHLVRLVDRWFQREPVDSSLAMARLEHQLRGSDSLRAMSAALGGELATALHATRVRVLLRAEDGASLVALDGASPPLPRDFVLHELLQSTRAELVLDARSNVARLLPGTEQDWIDQTGAAMLAPLVGASGALLGLAAVGEGANGLPYTASHLALVTAMCGHAAMQLENRWLWQTRREALTPAAGPGVEWRDEPAAWCPACGGVASADTRRCRCGTPTKPAVLPLFVNAKFRLQRLLGAGGAGVVYLATDLGLDRKVAVKTLPPMRREYAARLRREARAMAAVRHPNLATIYGVEEWRETPLLVVEYLEGGTLLDRLADGPLAVDETLDLGIVLADVLDRVHGSGVLHRDIKPSNIGYAADGMPKLLDFGLAAMLDQSLGRDGAAAGPVTDAWEVAARCGDLSASSTLTMSHQVVGTPLYLAPEAFAGQPPRESFDLWSLNVVLYECLAGRHPLAGREVLDVVDAVQHVPLPDVRDLRPDCAAPVAAFLAEALSPDPARRPVTAADLRTTLRELRLGLDPAR